MKERQRFVYLDWLKALAILLVCLYHFPADKALAYARPLSVGLVADRFARAFDAVCVPLFMMVNGALVLNGRFDLKKHALRTAGLFACVHVWYVITQVLIHIWRHGAAYAAANIKGILLSAAYLFEYDGVLTTHLWFIKMLVALYLLVPMVKAAFDSENDQLRKGLAFFLAGMVILCFLPKDYAHVHKAIPGFKHIDLSGLARMEPFEELYGGMMTYFVLGGVLHRCRQKVIAVRWRFIVLMMLGGWGLLCAEWLLMTIRIDAVYDIVCNAYDTVAALLLSVGLFAFAAKAEAAWPRMKDVRIVRLVGANTMAVYYLHWIVGHTVFTLLPVGGNPLLNLAKNAAMVLACALAGAGLRRVPVLRRLL